MHRSHARAAAGLVALGAVFGADAAMAQAAPGTTSRLIELLIANGALTRDQASELLRQAEAEAAAARPPARARPPAPRLPAAEVPAEAAVPPGTVRVGLVPEIVRRQIRDEVRRDLLTELRAGTALPGAGAALAPAAAGGPGLVTSDPASAIRLYGDLRMRAELIRFPSGNAPSTFFPNFQSINSGSGFDVIGTDLPGLLNTSEARDRYRLRARVGLEARLDSWVTADIRLATGNDSSPVSTNQTFGATSPALAQFGNFSRYAIWLDRAYLRMTPREGVTLDVGRMPNPFVSTDLVYDVDLNFDGVMARYRHRFNERLSAYLTAGAFPYFNTDLNFSSNQVEKFPSRDRYMYGLQAGADWRFASNWNASLNLGYYNFEGAEASISQPCAVPFAATACNTDTDRAAFTQNTNTFRPIRNLLVNPANPFGPQPQFFGRAAGFEVLDVYARLDYTGFTPFHVSFEGNYVNNLAFNRGRILANGVFGAGAPNGVINNLGPNNRFEGGGQGYLLRMTVGHRDVEARRWNWQVFAAYRYLESDAVLDAFADSDFRLGGTNSKGFVIGGSVGIARNSALRVRYLSGEQIAGPTFRSDVVQFDLTARF